MLNKIRIFFSNQRNLRLSQIANFWAVIISSLVACPLVILTIIENVKWGSEHSMFIVSLIISSIIIGLIACVVFVVSWSVILLVGKLFKKINDDTKVWQIVLAVLVMAIVFVISAFFLERAYLTKKILQVTNAQELNEIANRPFVLYEAKFINGSFALDVVPIARQIALSRYASPELLSRLYLVDNFVVKRGVAENPNTPKEVLEKLMAERNEGGYNIYVAELSKNPNASEDFFDQIYNYGIRTTASGKAEIKDLLTYDAKEVLNNLLQNPSVSIDLKTKIKTNFPYLVNQLKQQ